MNKTKDSIFGKVIIRDRMYSPLFKSASHRDKTNLTVIGIYTNMSLIKSKPDIESEYFTAMYYNFDGSYFKCSGQVLFWSNPIKKIPTRPFRKVIKRVLRET